VIARQFAGEMKKITKQRMAELMKTSRAEVDRLLVPANKYKLKVVTCHNGGPSSVLEAS
jgi:hypothetical protein